MEKRTLTLTSDPGHGWLSVSLKDIKELEIQSQITPYSFMTPSRAYLEEDLDAGIFLKAAKARGWDITLKETSVEKTPIRSFGSYNEKNLDWALNLNVGSQLNLYNSSTQAYSTKAKVVFIESSKIGIECEFGNRYKVSKNMLLKYTEPVIRPNVPKP